MPLLYLHLSIAWEAAGLMHHPLVEANMGSYLVGSISPDVHFVSGISRQETHFFALDEEYCASGTIAIFQHHPYLSMGNDIDDRTKAFVAGYLSHLVTDEAWILDIYRPFFGTSSPMGDDPLANVFDRLLQFDIDRREREDTARLESIREAICNWEPTVSIGFIDSDNLRKWRDFGCATVFREASLEDFPVYARNFLLPSNKIGAERLEPFLSTIYDKLEWAIQYVTPGRLSGFREKAISQSAAAAREYLNADN
jgi:hypothetical protein